jgi:hypothetical protein
MVQMKAPAAKLAAKRYAKKRTSLPVSTNVLKIDFDELPGAVMIETAKVPSSVQQHCSPREAPKTAKSMVTSEIRASAIKGKDEAFGNSTVMEVKPDAMGMKTRTKRPLNMNRLKIPDTNAIDLPEIKRATRSIKKKPDLKKVCFY